MNTILIYFYAMLLAIVLVIGGVLCEAWNIFAKPGGLMLMR